MKFSTKALAVTVGLASVNAQKPPREHTFFPERFRKRDLRGRELQAAAPELASPVNFGPVCPGLPANREPEGITDGWTRVNMDGYPYTDDGSSTESIPFTFSIYGTEYTTIFINNNGNLSFDEPYETYNPEGFPLQGFKMVAPFWADVDTGDGVVGDDYETLGRVWMKQIGTNTLAVAWDHVGYFSKNNDKRNTFQVMISDGSNPDMGIGNNVCFCYDQMQWTTGDFSNGVDGFGGFPATVGVNNDDGVNFSIFGRYDSPTVSSLDGRTFCFPIQAGSNINPIAAGIPDGGQVMLDCDETIDNLKIEFVAPENSQVITVQVEGVAHGVSVAVADGTADASVTINWAPSTAITVILTLTATDSAGGSTVVSLTFIAFGDACIDNKSGGTFGDPHFKTWADRYYDFHGICDLVLLDAPDYDNGVGLQVHIRTKARYEYSFIEAAAVKIGDDILEVNSWGEYLVNGVAHADLPTTLGPGAVEVTFNAKDKISGAFHLTLSEKESIAISHFKDMVAVKVHNATASNFARSVGMMGSYVDGTLVARDGNTVLDDLTRFGQEWQVLASEPQLFMTPSPVVGESCDAPTVFFSNHRRLSEVTIDKLAAEEACAHHKEAANFDMCVFDVMAMNDLEVATAAGAF